MAQAKGRPKKAKAKDAVAEVPQSNEEPNLRLRSRKRASPAVDPPPRDKSPSKRRRKNAEPIEADDNEDAASTQSDNDEESSLFTKIKMIVSGTCQICKVTPLFNLQNDAPSLKKYGKTMDTALLKHADKVDSTGTKAFTTTFSLYPYDENQDEGSKEFMIVEIFEQKGRDKETRSRCFMSMFFGCGSSNIGTRHLDRTKNAKNLPTVVYNGSSKYWKILQPALEALFSCNFLIPDLSQRVIKSISAAWILEAIRTQIAQRRDKLLLTYSHGLGTNSFGAMVNTIFAFSPFIPKWEGYLNDGEMNLHEVIKIIWSDISKEITAKEKISFAKAVILKVSATTFVIGTSGRFKLRLEDTDMIMAILKQITQALESARS